LPSRKKAQKKRRRVDVTKLLAALFVVLFPPVGILLTGKAKWGIWAKAALTGVALACMVLYVSLLPSAEYRVNGYVNLVGMNADARIYGPELPEAKVENFRIYGPMEAASVLAKEDLSVSSVKYYYAASDGECYHEYKCKFAFASSQKLTLREASILGYTPCGLCKPPVYTSGQ